ncbi:MAG: PLD nuclease N-terminal domain-containing protein [Rhodothermales bacterium]|nr:PLD nuclease N-terminal domain-containing protein [Rhodothermales bacterium]
MPLAFHRSAAALAVLTVALTGCGKNLIEQAQSPTFGICGLILLVLDVLALVEIWQSVRSTGDKVLWTVVIVIFPLIGLLLYYFLGRK